MATSVPEVATSGFQSSVGLVKIIDDLPDTPVTFSTSSSTSVNNNMHWPLLGPSSASFELASILCPLLWCNRLRCRGASQ